MRLAALPAALLAACAGSPPPLQPVQFSAPVPEQWLAGTAVPGEVDRQWWKRFGDEELDVLVDEALRENRDLRAAAARVEAAAVEARIAGAALVPALAATLDGARSKRNFIGFPIPGSSGRVL